MNNIQMDKAECWCNRLNQLMKKRNYTQKEFLKEYHKKYHGGTQANISRWLRVGNRIENGKTIGFPSYETMSNLADFFGVSVGYLTGETDYKSFDMEKVCDFLKSDEETVIAIIGITSGKSIPLGKYNADAYESVLHYILTADSFRDFVEEIQNYAEYIYRQKYSINNVNEVARNMKKDLFDLAVQCREYGCWSANGYGEVDDFKENNIEPTEELIEAINLLNDALHKDYEEESSIEQSIKLCEYKLQKIYFEIIKELSKEENLPNMIKRS